MYKKIVLLAKSKKHQNYCVAGKDVDTGEWVRLISEEEEIHNAVRPENLIYSDETEAQILDVIRAKVKEVDEENINPNQPENYILDKNYYLTKIEEETYNLDDMIDNTERIFFNDMNSISVEDLQDIDNIHSLVLIEPDIVRVRIKNETDLIANVWYKGVWYNNLTITDSRFNREYYNEIIDEPRSFRDFKIGVSLAEEYNNRHYKLIASVIEPQYYNANI